MKNPHIIVGANRRCLCGVYEVTEGPIRAQGSRTITCADVLKAIADAKVNRSYQVQPFVIDAAVKPLVQDCEDAPAAEGYTPEKIRQINSETSRMAYGPDFAKDAAKFMREAK